MKGILSTEAQRLVKKKKKKEEKEKAETKGMIKHKLQSENLSCF